MSNAFDPCNACTQAEHEITQLRTRVAQLQAALAALFGRVEDGTLVRDVSRDTEPGWSLRAATFVMELQRAHEALTTDDGAALGVITAFLSAYAHCEANRGAFSCNELHDRSCEKARVIEAGCTCGRDELETALAAARKAFGL